MFRGIKLVYREEGFLALYKGKLIIFLFLIGLSMALARELSYGSIRIFLYEPIKDSFGYDIHNTPFWVRLVSGLTAGSVAATLTNPIDV